MNKNLMIVIAALLVIFGLVMSGYNNLVGMNENINGKWSQIENQLQRRNDLIPNLVNTVKGYAAHESDVFKAVADARAKLGGAKTVQEASQADGELSGALSRLLMVAENYPQLKANANFTQLQASLEDTENKISYARQSYNDCVLSYNNAIQTFPAVIFAGIFQFKERQGFEAAEAARQDPTVKF